VGLLILFVFLGTLIGAYGTLIGAGGGFILVPLLLWVYPEKEPEVITSISLAVVSVNSWSGVLAYSRMKRIDYHAGWLFALANIPGAMLGAYSTTFLQRAAFDAIFGILLIISSFLLLRRTTTRLSEPDTNPNPSERRVRVSLTSFLLPTVDYPLTTLASRRFRAALVLSFVIGYLSSMIGIGGGIFQVPMMAYGLNFPVHMAVATSEFVLAIKALSASSVHLFSGTLLQVLPQVLSLSVGVFVGAQVGARLSTHIQGAWIIRLLAISIGLIGIQFLVGVF
jgi:hypothetical protein